MSNSINLSNRSGSSFKHGRLYILAMLAALSVGSHGLNAQKPQAANTIASEASRLPAYRDSRLSPRARSLDLLSRMSAKEKIGQLSTLFGWEMYQKDSNNNISVTDKLKTAIDSAHIGMLWGTLRADPWTRKTLENGLYPKEAVQATNAIQKYAITHSRWGIPLLLAEECAHGLMAIGTTVYPTAIGQASTWDPSLIKKVAASIAAETRVMGSHIAYGPILDLAREPRWSRVEETYGEDTYLVTEMGTAFTQGLQGENLLHSASSPSTDSLHVISTLKHFLAYGIPAGGHNGGPAVLGSRMLYSDYLPPFASAIKKAGALSVMTAYNSIDGIPCTSNGLLIRNLLKARWGFQGFVVSDLGSISGLYSSSHTAANPAEAAAQALSAGVDSDLGGYGFGGHLQQALQEGLVSQADLDSAVYRVLQLKFALGLFEQPYRSVAGTAEVHSSRHRDLNLKTAAESIVLLKKTILPLSKDIKSLAVIGPNADNTYNQLGDYTAPQDPATVTTVLEGIRQLAAENKMKVHYAKGCAIRDSSTAGFAEALNAARAADAVVVVLGGSSARDFKTKYQSTGAAIANETTVSDMENGEGNDRSTLKLLGRQSALLSQLAATGKPIILILINGRPIAFEKEAGQAGDILEAWYPGAAGGQAIASILFGIQGPAGRLPISIPRSVGQLPDYYSQPKGSGGHYVEGSAQPLYPFGFGLSYSSFSYSNLQIKKEEKKENVFADLSYAVKNTGSLPATDIQEVYITDQTSSVVTPIRHLVGFTRCQLAPGASVTQHIRLDTSALCLWNAQGKQVIEPGSFRIEIAKFAGDPDALKGQLDISHIYILDTEAAP